MPRRKSPTSNWTAIIGRSLAMIAMEEAGLIDKTLAKQARFLEAIGLSRSDVAALLGTTPRELAGESSGANRKKAVPRKKRALRSRSK